MNASRIGIAKPLRAVRQLTAAAAMTLLLSCAQSPSTQSGPVQTLPQSNSVTPTAILSYDYINHPVVANAGMVVSQNALASEVGRGVLLAGGNAVDASVAMGFALAVTLPRAGNIGGSGFMLLYKPGEQPAALDFRSAAPSRFPPNQYRDASGKIDRNQLKFGAHTAGVPGTIAGLYAAWQRGGSLSWAQLVAPAIKLAREGIVVSHDLAKALAAEENVFQRFSASRQQYLTRGNQPPQEGETWRQPELAATLQEIASSGQDAFYRGTIARRLVSAMQRDGGYITLQDLDGYRARWREPISTTYRGKRVVAMPPVSGGGLTLLQMLNVLQHFKLKEYPQGSAASLHLLAETMKRGAANRRVGIGDPDFVDVAISQRLSQKLAREIANGIDIQRATPVGEIKPLEDSPPESRDTTHYSVVDRWGNAVATTYTLGYSFGSGYVVAGTGILLDNQLRNFAYQSASHANGYAPGKRMMSTMTPTMVFSGAGELELVTGTPGGGRIINVLLQLLVNVIDYDMNIAAATHSPRIHQAWRSPELTVERGISSDTLSLLEQRGHTVLMQPSMGSTQSIRLRNGLMYGAADPRRPGALAVGIVQAALPAK